MSSSNNFELPVDKKLRQFNDWLFTLLYVVNVSNIFFI